MHSEHDLAIQQMQRKRWAELVLAGFCGMPLDEMHVDTMRAIALANRIARGQCISNEELVEFLEFVLNLPIITEVVEAETKS